MNNEPEEEYTPTDAAYDEGHFFGMMKGFGYGLILSALTMQLLVLLHHRGLI